MSRLARDAYFWKFEDHSSSIAHFLYTFDIQPHFAHLCSAREPIGWDQDLLEPLLLAPRTSWTLNQIILCLEKKVQARLVANGEDSRTTSMTAEDVRNVRDTIARAEIEEGENEDEDNIEDKDEEEYPMMRAPSFGLQHTQFPTP